eukprot:CAMPEP_0115853146 /NCGR_PEP_ID=MMETSP0287-20121206/13355_1 /TAXON_ID=412157 /ORGANISM="Chrysochromulina rotalis, Strain UIO044" /LENGTH=176 /DNA_ID=CAMNT_0003307217 /DNA_START=39 /DNA_END=569 /DNA_ORIENTATION=+
MLRVLLLIVACGVSDALNIGARAPVRAPVVRMDLFGDLQKSFAGAFAAKPKAAARMPAGGLPVPKDVFDEELSAWPAIIEIQEGLTKMSPEEQRRQKLEVGTNWQPRTTTADPFGIDRQGFMFFQGPTPKTSVQPDLPSFLSGENFSDMEVPTELKVVGGVFAASFAGVAGLVITA